MSLDNIGELRKFLVLKSIAEEGSFRAASRKLGITPSAVSQSLSSLEKKLGFNLVFREQSGVTLTKEGQEILEKVTPAFAIVDGLFHKEEDLEIGRLDLGAYESLGIDVLPKMIKTVKLEFPNAKLNFYTGRSNALVQKLKKGEICTAIIVEDENMENISKSVIAEDELAVYVSKDNAFLENPKELISESGLAILNPGKEGHSLFYSKYLSSLEPFQTVLTTDSMEVIAATILKGDIAGVLPKRVAKRYDQKLVEINIQKPDKQDIKGNHRIILAYYDKCDDREAEYLSNIVKRIIF